MQPTNEISKQNPHIMMTDVQRRYLQNIVSELKFPLRTLGGLFAVFFIGLVVVGIWRSVESGFLAFILGVAGYKWSQADSDLRGKRVDYREGVISLDVVGGGQGGATYKVSIEGQTFVISKELFLSLSNHQPYRIYFAPKSRFILGTEPL